MSKRAGPRLFFLLNRARQSLFGRLNRETTARLDVTVSQLSALFALGSGAMPTGALARRLELDAGATTRAVARLTAKGLVESRPDPSDGRRRVVQLTEAGAKRREQGVHELTRANALLHEGFSEAEIEVVARFLEHVATLGQSDDDD
ncbi:MAG: MarR family transcriptional regulator [Myxococcota bacterium]